MVAEREPFRKHSLIDLSTPCVPYRRLSRKASAQKRAQHLCAKSTLCRAATPMVTTPAPQTREKRKRHLGRHTVHTTHHVPKSKESLDSILPHKRSLKNYSWARVVQSVPLWADICEDRLVFIYLHTAVFTFPSRAVHVQSCWVSMSESSSIRYR